MQREFSREQRLADLLQRELTVLIRDQMRDPRVGTVSVTHVKVTRDLAWADVYVSQLEAQDSESRAEVLAALRGAAGFLRSMLARIVRARTTPQLRFKYDELIDQGIHMDAAIAEALERDQKLRAQQPDQETGDAPGRDTLDGEEHGEA